MNAEYLRTKIGHLKEQRDRAVADADRFRALNDSLIEDNEVLQKEIAQMCERGAAYVNDNESLRAKRAAQKEQAV